MSVSVGVLAGGRSARMGCNKAFVEIDGQPLIERVLSRVSGLGDEVLLIANEPEPYAYLGLPIYYDVIPGKGALGGIYTALVHAGNEHALVVACDMPFLNQELLKYLIILREGYDVVAPLDRLAHPQSTHAVYSRTCLGPIRCKLDEGQMKAISFYPEMRLRQVGDDELDRFDPHRCSFININTPDDLVAAHALVARSVCS